MERINIIIDDPAARFGPYGLYLTGLGRVEPRDGEMSVDGYGFNGEAWAWWRTGWYAWYHRNHDFSWAYLFDFSNGLQGVSRVMNVNAALAAVGARFDPAGPPDPVPPADQLTTGGTTIDWQALLTAEYDRIQRRRGAEGYAVRNPSGIIYIPPQLREEDDLI